MTRMPPSVGAKSMASLTDRSVSANRDSGAFTTCWNTPRSRASTRPPVASLRAAADGRRAWPRASLGRMPRQATPENPLDLSGRAERPVGKLASERQHQAQRKTADTRQRKRDDRLGRRLLARRRGFGEHARVGDRERLLLQGRFVAVEEALIEVLVGLGVPLQLAQAHPCLRDVGRAGRGGFKRLRKIGFLLDRDLEVALVDLFDAPEFLQDQPVDVLHLAARLLGGLMLGAIAPRNVRLLLSHPGILLAQLVDHRARERIDNRRVGIAGSDHLRDLIVARAPRTPFPSAPPPAAWKDPSAGCRTAAGRCRYWCR